MSSFRYVYPFRGAAVSKEFTIFVQSLQPSPSSPSLVDSQKQKISICKTVGEQLENSETLEERQKKRILSSQKHSEGGRDAVNPKLGQISRQLINWKVAEAKHLSSTSSI